MFQRVLCVFTFVVLFILGFAVPASAQSNDGRILGTVTDSQERVVVEQNCNPAPAPVRRRNLSQTALETTPRPRFSPGCIRSSGSTPFKKVEHSNVGS